MWAFSIDTSYTPTIAGPGRDHKRRGAVPEIRKSGNQEYLIYPLRNYITTVRALRYAHLDHLVIREWREVASAPGQTASFGPGPPLSGTVDSVEWRGGRGGQNPFGRRVGRQAKRSGGRRRYSNEQVRCIAVRRACAERTTTRAAEAVSGAQRRSGDRCTPTVCTSSAINVRSPCQAAQAAGGT